jgi:hypothetical protein
MQARALLRLHAAEAEMAEVAGRGRERGGDPDQVRDQVRDRHRLLQLLHGHAEAARRRVRKLSMPWHGYAAAPHGAQPSSGRDSERELDAAVADELRNTGSVAREELLDPRLVSREASPDALRSTQGSTSPGAGAGARARTPSPALLPEPASRDRSLWSLLLGGQ